jgi:Tol biopolymer transport system component
MLHKIPGPKKLALSIVALALAVIAGEWADAAKPPPPPPPPPAPPGTIYFTYGAQVWRMDSDGSAKAFDHTLAGVFADNIGLNEPSSLAYGGFRWWVTVASPDGSQYDVYAYRPTGSGTVAVVQLTDLGADINWAGNARWANDGADSYMAFAANSSVDGLTRLCRIDVSSADLESFGSAIPPATTSDLVVLHTSSNSSLVGYALSPPALNAAVYGRQNAGGNPVVVVVDLDDGTEYEILNLAGSPSPAQAGHDWSRDGAKIAFRRGDSIATVNPDGSGLTNIVVGPITSKGKKTWFRHPRFSPDGQGIAFGEERNTDQVVGADQWDIDRVATTGGSIVKLTSSLTATSPKIVLGWRP